MLNRSVSDLRFGRSAARCKCNVQYKNKVNQKEALVIPLAYWADGKDNQQRKGGCGYGTTM